MAENNNLDIKSIRDLLQYKFFIPSYQRGYRWTKQQVEDLLNDINEFSPKEIEDSNEKTWYCLQPIVVKRRISETKFYFRNELVKNSNLETDEAAIITTKKLIEKVERHRNWDVIDGQQRLTTIYLILHYLNQINTKEGRIKLFELEYETRKDSANYLRSELGKVEKDTKNIDYFHISIAYQTIIDWFTEKMPVDSFELKFKGSTKVIWYETADKDSINIFTRINMGKIPLTNAELIKALFLNSSNFKDLKPDKLRLKQLEISSEWDKIEYDLQDDAFWYFINKEENNLATRIEFIFDLIYEVAKEMDAEITKGKQLNIKTKEQIEENKINLTISEKFGNDEYSTFRYFNDRYKNKSENEILANWQEIKKYYQILEEWFTDRELYHKVGFLVASGTEIRAIISLKKGLTKTDFIATLADKIKIKVDIDLDNLEYGNGMVRNVLLLHNIQTMLNNINETSRFPFDRYKKENWDVEHIHANATEVRVKEDNQKKWLENNFIKTEIHKEVEKNKQIEQIISSGVPIVENAFSSIVEYVLGEEDNNIRNLCLLDRGTNRSYKNDGFKEKRRKIISREMKGTFIPICTKNVFMKYYSDEVKDLELWDEKNDRKSYHDKIQDVINQYLPKKTTV